MWGIHFYGCRWAPVRGFLCLLWRKAHTKDLCLRFPMRPEEDQERQGPRSVNRRKKSATIRGKATVREMWLLKEELEPVDSAVRSANVRGWVNIYGGYVGISLKYRHLIATDAQKPTEKCQNFSLLVLGANPGLCLFVLLSSTLDYICCICIVFVKHVKCPHLEMRETTGQSDGHELV